MAGKAAFDTFVTERAPALRRTASGGIVVVVALTAQLALTGSVTSEAPGATPRQTATLENSEDDPLDEPRQPDTPTGVVTLAFAGDVHFQLHLASLLSHPRGSLGPITRTLQAADVTMVNLESSITERGKRTHLDYAFRTTPVAFEVLDASGVDLVTMANNHAVDYGPIGLSDTLKAVRQGPLPVIGIGTDVEAAFRPHRVTVGDTDIAFFAASSEPDQLALAAAGPDSPGIAAAWAATPRVLLAKVREASRRDDVVVVYMHWGKEYQSCPTEKQRITAGALANAGADVIVGSHAHVLLGSGWLGGTYVNYGLGNFLWYHNREPESGVLEVRIRDGAVVGDTWRPAMIQAHGRPHPLVGRQRVEAVGDWERLRACAGLAASPSARSEDQGQRVSTPPPYTASVHRIGPELRARMSVSHARGCPVPMAQLRYLRLAHIGFDGKVHTGEIVVNQKHAAQVVGVFERLYDARWPIRRMRLVDEYAGNDKLSMAANNTSGFNCRRVADSDNWSAHAYGAAIDINPVQNPYQTGMGFLPRSGSSFAAIDRSGGAPVPAGAIAAGDTVVRAFERIGWKWGGAWLTSPDFQHFYAPVPERP